EQFAGFQHRVHQYGELASDGNSCALEADPFSELEAPRPQIAVCRGACENYRRRFVKQSAQMAVASPRYMTVIVYFSGLVAPSRQPEPCADGTGFLEVVGIFDCSRERCRCDCTYPWDRHEDLTRLAPPCAGDKLSPEFSRFDADATPSLENRQNDSGESLLVDEKVSNMLLELASLTCRYEQPER